MTAVYPIARSRSRLSGSAIQQPWVDPSNGATYMLPAKARLDAGTPNAVA